MKKYLAEKTDETQKDYVAYSKSRVAALSAR